jgi:multicomponent Na+:H+ antiporter subunit B
VTRTARFVLFGICMAGLAPLLCLAILHLPAFGSTDHPYRTAAIAAAVLHATANAVSSVNFDLRGLDTLGEESIFLASVVVIAVVLREASDESEERQRPSGRPLESTIAGGLFFLPIILIIGLDVISHGHLTPGGGFQGGVIVGTGVHLAYVAGTYGALERVRPVRPFEWTEAIGAAAFACLGLSALLLGASFLANVIPFGSFGTLFSAGTVPLLNGIVGIEVASGVIVLLSKFFEQAMTVRSAGGDGGPAHARTSERSDA